METLALMRDVAIVSFAQAPLEQPPGQTETLMLLPTITEALSAVGLTRRDVGFTCSGSADYLTGGTFTFVQMLEAAGAWPPISESHVEMDGAWALYEAWVRLQHGDVDVALVFSSGRASLGVSLRETLTFQLDPYYLADRRRLRVAGRAPGPGGARARRAHREGSRPDRGATPPRRGRQSERGGVGNRERRRAARRRLRGRAAARHDIGPPVDGAAAVVLVAGDRAKDVCDRPAWIRGIDHRVDPHYPGVRDLASSPSATIAGERAGVSNGGVEVAELAAVCTPEELVLEEALGLGQ